MRKHIIKTALLALACLAAYMVVLAGCSARTSETTTDAAPMPTLADCPVSRDTSFGGVYINATIDEFNELGFAYGL